MRFCWKKFPRQARLCSKKSLDGSRWTLRQKKFLRNQKSQELFREQTGQRPRHSAKRQHPTQTLSQTATPEPDAQPNGSTRARRSAKRQHPSQTLSQTATPAPGTRSLLILCETERIFSSHKARSLHPVRCNRLPQWRFSIFLHPAVPRQ